MTTGTLVAAHGTHEPVSSGTAEDTELSRLLHRDGRNLLMQGSILGHTRLSPHNCTPQAPGEMLNTKQERILFLENSL